MGTLTLAGCGTTERLIRERPPFELTADCAKPIIQVKTNRELANSLLTMADALDKCNLDKAAMRRWAEQAD